MSSKWSTFRTAELWATRPVNGFNGYNGCNRSSINLVATATGQDALQDESLSFDLEVSGPKSRINPAYAV
jgi:hypothetical protein